MADRKRRIILILAGISLVFVFLLGKLFCLQILNGPGLARSAVRQRISGLVIYDKRGDIKDRHGISLLDRGWRKGLVAFPVLYRGREEEIVSALSRLEGTDRVADPPRGSLPFWLYLGSGDVGAGWGIPGTFPAVLPGILEAAYPVRYGPDLLACHLVGYLQESEGRGVSGIEAAFDRELSRGQETVLGALVDGSQGLIGGLGYRATRKGESALDVILTLDSSLQREVERIADRYIGRGAVVVMDCRGDILALASRPAFHPARLENYLNGERGALINRALMEYQPGSVFKTVVAAAALEEGLVSLFQRFHCSGGVEAGGLYFQCTCLHPDPLLSLAEAFAYSCNSVFIELAQELGGERLLDYARRFGLGEATGFLLDETYGLLPEKNDLNNSRALANAALGHGAVMVTPLQMASLMAIIANGGYRVRPRLVQALENTDRQIVRYFGTQQGERVLSPATVNRLKYLLHGVMATGTGRPGALTVLPAGAKTGTAESGRRENGRALYNYWAAGFYPLEGAEAVIVVFADEMKEGRPIDAFGKIALFLEQGSDLPSLVR